MQYGTSEVVFYEGENSIGADLSLKPDDYRKIVFSQWVQRILNSLFGELEAMDSQQDVDQKIM